MHQHHHIMLIFQRMIPADPPNACIHQQHLALNLYQQNKRSFSETHELQSSVKKKEKKICVFCHLHCPTAIPG